MSTKNGRSDSTIDILKDLLIVQLGMARVPQQTIQQIVRCDIVRVNRIVKHLKIKKPATGEA